MKRCCIAAALVLLCLLLGGCTDPLDYSAVETEVYTQQSAPVLEPERISADDRDALREALLELVYSGETKRTVVFSPEYEGSAEDDLAYLTQALRREDAYCAYALQDISYVFNNIVGRPQAEVSLLYIDSAPGPDELVRLPFAAGAEDAILEALRTDREDLLILINASPYSAIGIKELAESVYRHNPLSSVVKPDVQVLMYSGSDKQRLYDISFGYQLSPAERIRRRSQLLNLDIGIDTGADEKSDTEKLNALYTYFGTGRTLCTHEEHDTVYDALILREANSEGMALAFSEAAAQLGLEAMIVYGQLDFEDCCWNIVSLEGQWRHTDLRFVLEHKPNIPEPAVDDIMWQAGYRWDTAGYPKCGSTEETPGGDTNESENGS